MIKNCYIHIPFCENICSYCDFCKMYYKEELVDKYLNTLEQEINSIYKGEKLETIYIGGGTPSCLNIKQLERLFVILSKLNKSTKKTVLMMYAFNFLCSSISIFYALGDNHLAIILYIVLIVITVILIFKTDILFEHKK